MKIDFGETWEEKTERIGKWHKWFAWYPVKLADHDWRWLEVVERRGYYDYGYGWDDLVWHYREKSS